MQVHAHEPAGAQRRARPTQETMATASAMKGMADFHERGADSMLVRGLLDG